MEHLRDSHRVNDNWSCLFLSDPIFIKRKHVINPFIRIPLDYNKNLKRNSCGRPQRHPQNTHKYNILDDFLFEEKEQNLFNSTFIMHYDIEILPRL